MSEPPASQPVPEAAASPKDASPGEPAATEPLPPAGVDAPPPVEPPHAESPPVAQTSLPAPAPEPVPSPSEPARRKDRVVGLSIVLIAFVVGVGISLAAKRASRPETSEPPGPPTTVGVIGWRERVDVAKTMPRARELSQRPALRGFVAEGVKSDGTIDLSEGPGRARYSFQSPPGHGPQPIGEGGLPVRRVFCGRQNVFLRTEGLVAEPDVADAPCQAKIPEPLPDPQCSLATIWQAALQRGVPSDRLARIEYYRSRSGPAWRFELPEGQHRFSLYGDCKRELRGSQASGHVP
jgi:hypothetical protein